MKEKFNKYFYFLFINIFAFISPVLAADKPLMEVTKDCSDLPTEIVSDINLFWSYMIVIAPIIFIISAFMDIIKIISSGDDKAISSSIRKIMKKFIALVILLILPKLIAFIIGLLNPSLGTCVS